jgi:hypothetical protein
MIQPVSLSEVKLTQVMDNWAALVNVVYAGLTDNVNIKLRNKWIDLGERFVDVMLLMNNKNDMVSEKETNRFQLVLDIFSRLYRDLVGENKETNYMQNISAGIFRFFLIKYGSIYAYNNTAMEACVGREKNFFHHGTQHDVDGHRGKPLIVAFMHRHMVQRAILMDSLAPGTIDAAVTKGKSILNSARNQKDRKRREDQRDLLDADGILKNDCRKRVATTTAEGKRSYSWVEFKAGESLPPKPKRIRKGPTLFNLLVEALKD